MPILLVPVRPDPAVEAIARRLIDAGDQVRVIWSGDAGPLRDLGAFVARGHPNDADLVERAAFGCETIVVVDRERSARLDVLDAVRPLQVDRVVYVGGIRSDDVVSACSSLGRERILLWTRRGGLRRREAAPDVIAAAVDAADAVEQVSAGEMDLLDEPF